MIELEVSQDSLNLGLDIFRKVSEMRGEGKFVEGFLGELLHDFVDLLPLVFPREILVLADFFQLAVDVSGKGFLEVWRWLKTRKLLTRNSKR